MSSYGDFASIYDKLITEDYDEWADYIELIFAKYKIQPKLVLDLACGTGNITNRLASRGYDMTGIDLSEEMLMIANDKAISKNLNVQYLCQDMTQFELYGTVDAIICTLDAINYITLLSNLQDTFSLVRNYLNPNGIFIFDVNTQYKFEKTLGENIYVDETEDIYYTWVNKYSKKTKICKMFLTFFIKNGIKYSRVDEAQIQRFYSDDEIISCLNEAGLTLLGRFDKLSFENPKTNGERTVFVAKYLC